MTVLATIAGMSLALIGMASGVKPLVAAGTLLTGFSFALAMVQSQRAGVIRTNYGILRRTENPVGFWAAAMFWWTVVLFWTLGGVLHGLGWLVR